MKFHDFLNPKSMMTPGIAGMVIMGISNSLWVTLSIPKVGSSFFLSFLLALLVLKKIKMAAFYEKTIYLIFNTLIIFSLAVNTNFAGRKISEVSFGEPVSFSQQYTSQFNPKFPSGSIYINNHREDVATTPLVGYQQETTPPFMTSPSTIKTERMFFDPYL